MAVVLLLITNKVYAEVDYTRDFPASDGTIELNLTGLQLDESKQYEFALVAKGGTPESWNLITSFTSTTAKLLLNPATISIRDVLKITDDGQVFVREKDNTSSYIVDRLNVNLKLPYLKAVSYEKMNSTYVIGTIYEKIGDSWTNGGRTYYKFEKVKDKNLIQEFLKDKNNIYRLENLLPTPPDIGYTEDRQFNHSSYNDGLYILWIRLTGENCKTVQAAIIHDGVPNATTLAEYGVDPEQPEASGLVSIEIKNAPKKTVYKVGEKFDKTGMIITAKYQDGTQKDVTNYTYSPSGELKESDKTIIISYTENGVTKQTSQPIKVTIDGDNTKSPVKIPGAGIKLGVITSIIVIGIIGMYAYKRNKNLKGI